MAQVEAVVEQFEGQEALEERVIEIAHPQYRDGLIRDAQKMGVWRRSNKVCQ